jgi:hypothetical protein
MKYTDQVAAPTMIGPMVATPASRRRSSTCTNRSSVTVKAQCCMRCQGIAVGLLGTLGHLEKGQQGIAAGIEEIVAQVLERRVAAVARADADPGRHPQGMHQRHAEHAAVESPSWHFMSGC